jgi:hypothetical protein
LFVVPFVIGVGVVGVVSGKNDELCGKKRVRELMFIFSLLAYEFAEGDFR